MRFSRCPYRLQRQPVTRQRLAAARRAIARQMERAGLFAEHDSYETPEQRLERLEAERLEWVRKMRERWLKDWRAIRTALFALPEDRRREIVALWRASPYPASPEYMMDFLRRHGVLVRTEGDIYAEMVRNIRVHSEAERERQADRSGDYPEQVALSW